MLLLVRKREHIRVSQPRESLQDVRRAMSPHSMPRTGARALSGLRWARMSGMAEKQTLARGHQILEIIVELIVARNHLTL